MLNALERLATGYGADCDRIRQDLAIAESQLGDYQARLGKPFAHESYQSELTTLRDQLKAGLSGAAQENDKREGPSVSELAERIKALKAANTVESTPQRAGGRPSSAEEPITSRIRRRAEANSATDPMVLPTVLDSAEGKSLPPRLPNESPVNPGMTFQERIAMERRQQGSPDRIS